MQSRPKNKEELLERTRDIAGLTLFELANKCKIQLPTDLQKNKGFVGQLLEYYLGAEAGSKPEPDFLNLGIELKTIPINERGKPCETTFVCSIPLLEIGRECWQTSLVRKKLSCVLWLPIEGSRMIPLAERQIGSAILWNMDFESEMMLRQDWEELIEMITLGQLEKITAHHGVYLQVRPKGLNAKSLCYGYNEEGDKIKTLPRGFYLRTTLTDKILTDHYII